MSPLRQTQDDFGTAATINVSTQRILRLNPYRILGIRMLTGVGGLVYDVVASLRFPLQPGDSRNEEFRLTCG